MDFHKKYVLSIITLQANLMFIIIVNEHVLISCLTVAGLAAYVLGKVSYQGECRKKIMALENSPLAEAMKKGRRGRELITDM